MTNISSTVVYFLHGILDTAMTNIVMIRKLMLVCVNDWKRYWVATIPGIWYLGPSLHQPTYTLNVGIPMSAWDEGKLDEDDGK